MTEFDAAKPNQRSLRWSALRACWKPVLLLAALILAAGSFGSLTHAVSPIRTIAGQELFCQDFRGRSVVNMHVANLGDVGYARVINTVPYILLDPEQLRRLPPKLQLFFYSHECAHHQLGHWFNPTPQSEREADCWAIKTNRDKGLFTRYEVKRFAPWFANSNGSRWGHLPGPERVKHMLKCFDEP